jgi:hypothetical protein
MQDLGAEVRDLRRLAVVELGDEPRIRDLTGVRGEDARYGLPQDHTRGAEDAPEKGSRQVRAAAAQRGYGPVGGAAEEARHDRRNALSQERRESLPRARARFGQVRGRRAMMAVGGYDVERVHPRRRAAGRGERRGDDRRGHPLAAGDEDVARPRREMAEGRHRPADLAVLAGRPVGFGQETTAIRPGRDQVQDERGAGAGTPPPGRWPRPRLRKQSDGRLRAAHR